MDRRIDRIWTQGGSSPAVSRDSSETWDVGSCSTDQVQLTVLTEMLVVDAHSVVYRAGFGEPIVDTLKLLLASHTAAWSLETAGTHDEEWTWSKSDQPHTSLYQKLSLIYDPGWPIDQTGRPDFLLCRRPTIGKAPSLAEVLDPVRAWAKALKKGPGDSRLRALHGIEAIADRFDLLVYLLEGLVFIFVPVARHGEVDDAVKRAAEDHYLATLDGARVLL